MILADALLLIGIGFAFMLFWQGRRQAEQARNYVEHYCQQQQLQFIDMAWKSGKITKIKRHVGWLSRYEFDFSSDGESRYTGCATLLNMRLIDITTPPYRIPQD